MATVAITIQDTEEGFDVRIESEPAFKKENLTPGQELAMEIAGLIHSLQNMKGVTEVKATATTPDGKEHTI